jgi:hypothetical protein
MEEDSVSPDSIKMLAVKDTSGDMPSDEGAGGIVPYVEGRFRKAETAWCLLLGIDY